VQEQVERQVVPPPGQDQAINDPKLVHPRKPKKRKKRKKIVMMKTRMK
jgi:hypothetical protein